MNNDTPDVQEYAGFWRRFAAYLIDGVIVAFAVLQLRALWWAQMVSIYDIDTLNKILTGVVSTMTFLLTWVYTSGMESSPLQGTIGKLAVGLYVTDLQGQRISFRKASGRYFGKILSGLILSIGFIMAGFTARKQALHDMMAGCLVMRK